MKRNMGKSYSQKVTGEEYLEDTNRQKNSKRSPRRKKNKFEMGMGLHPIILLGPYERRRSSRPCSNSEGVSGGEKRGGEMDRQQYQLKRRQGSGACLGRIQEKKQAKQSSFCKGRRGRQRSQAHARLNVVKWGLRAACQDWSIQSTSWAQESSEKKSPSPPTAIVRN